MVLVLAELVVMVVSAAYAHSLAATIAAEPEPAIARRLGGADRDIAVPSAGAAARGDGPFLGPWTGIVAYQLTEKAVTPLVFTGIFGWETLAYMLFGMAALKSGFLTGGWDSGRYRRAALIGLAIAVPAYAMLAALIFADDFSVPGLFTYSFAATVPFRPLMVVAYAALAVLATRRGGWLVDRIAAAGRAAFSNYLGTSIVMTGLFYGWGLGWFGSLSRVELWLVVMAMWAGDAGLVEAVARPFPLRPVRMAVAQPRAVGSAADAEVAERGTSLPQPSANCSANSERAAR